MEQLDKTEQLDPEQMRLAAELAAMPWRDKENWVKSNAQVIRMRKAMEEKERALKTKMEQVRSIFNSIPLREYDDTGSSRPPAVTQHHTHCCNDCD